MDKIEQECCINRMGILIEHKQQLTMKLKFQLELGYEKEHPELAKAYSDLEQAFKNVIAEEAKFLS